MAKFCWNATRQALNRAVWAAKRTAYVGCALMVADGAAIQQAHAEPKVKLSDVKGSYTTILERQTAVSIKYSKYRAMVNLSDFGFVAPTEGTPAFILLLLAQQQYQIFLAKMRAKVVERNHTSDAIDILNAIFEDADPTLKEKSEANRLLGQIYRTLGDAGKAEAYHRRALGVLETVSIDQKLAFMQAYGDSVGEPEKLETVQEVFKEFRSMLPRRFDFTNKSSWQNARFLVPHNTDLAQKLLYCSSQVRHSDPALAKDLAAAAGWLAKNPKGSNSLTTELARKDMNEVKEIIRKNAEKK